jgi:superfamily II DNA or RNA helicase
MSEPKSQLGKPGREPVDLTITIDVPAGTLLFEWTGANAEMAARGRLLPAQDNALFATLYWALEGAGNTRTDACQSWPASTRALINRIRKLFPVPEGALRIGLLTDQKVGPAEAGSWYPMVFPPGHDCWKWLSQQVQQFARLIEANPAPGGSPAERGRAALHLLACALMGVAPAAPPESGPPPGKPLLDLRLTFDRVEGFASFVWSEPHTGAIAAAGRIRCTGADRLTWELEIGGQRETGFSSQARESIRTALGNWLKRFRTNQNSFTGSWIIPGRGTSKPVIRHEPPFGPDRPPYQWIEDHLVGMAEEMRGQFMPLAKILDEFASESFSDLERLGRRLLRKEQKRSEEEARRRENMARLAEERRRREQRQAGARRNTATAATTAKNTPPPGPQNAPPKERPPLPPVPVKIDLPPLAFQETAFPLASLHAYSIQERAALWWVSNQSDDLLCLPHCRIERLDYQLRAALRVLGPLRGRALLSDEVGLGKTVEAGLVIKELLTRGMVKRFLVLTVPSLVDQWEEELSDKFGLAAATTNQAVSRADPREFWGAHPGIVASLHTLKQPAHLAVARQVHWDILIVDEAHHLRNRDSQAWQAVNALPRQFLLLLTATPVQNSLEELYNLVTLLQPGQLPTPKEFRARFFDPKRPRQPREPEELRRLLGQVMIRNTRANAGVQLPPRRAETVLFEATETENAFWQQWDAEFRASLAGLNGGQASLWGRLVLQASGSSPAAWRASLAKFPAREKAEVWRKEAPLETSWQKKCELIPPLTRAEGGAVIFSQFLETQSALAEFLRRANVETFVINGATPAPERQPITEEFRKRGGALLLTHSGTEGRNLQFCHRLVNFDLPWNPMEIEQRIGRLHRLGQQHPVRIYNFVQSGTLQEHLLEILQEKLNLFELVVGETGLVLGERFGSDEFAEEILRRWRESEGRVAEALATLGEDLAAARDQYGEVKQLDETLFAKDYESL